MSHSFVISAPHSNSGKTACTLALMKAFKTQGLKVHGFKCGPDYIDPIFHEKMVGAKSVNLDGVFQEQGEMQSLFQQYQVPNSVSIVEGVMGLFDGSEGRKNSTADIAITLDIPVILVVDASAMAHSVAPLVAGFKNYDPKLKFAGVILNKVGSEGHYRMLKSALDSIEVPCFGWFPDSPLLQIPERHLGLDFSHEIFETSETNVENLTEHLDLDLILDTTKSKNTANQALIHPENEKKELPICSIAQDEAFSFLYAQNLNQLRGKYQLVFISPLRDSAIPTNTQLLYFPGGYPELHLEALSNNTEFIKSVQQFAQNGGEVFGECGGFMYMGAAIIGTDGRSYPMLNIFSSITNFQHPKMHLGYRELHLKTGVLKGHEFHFSRLQNEPETDLRVKHQNSIHNSPFYLSNGCIGSFCHFYFGSHSSFPLFLSLWSDRK
ncbi:MAG: cobyrinic acid a,c-diamide synthase [Luteibaculaceae bacterium]|jgi:cobyrinic acid a,c-diamide synthase